MRTVASSAIGCRATDPPVRKAAPAPTAATRPRHREGTDGERTAGDEYDRVFWVEGGYVYGSRDDDEE